MHASLSRFLSMKGAGNVIYFNGSNPWGILLAAMLPTAFLVPRARHKSEFPAVLHGLDKSSKSVKAQKLNLRHCSWLDFHLKKTKKQNTTDVNSPFLCFPLLCFRHIIAVVCPGDAEKSLLLLDFLHLYSPQKHIATWLFPHQKMRFLALLQS